MNNESYNEVIIEKIDSYEQDFVIILLIKFVETSFIAWLITDEREEQQ